MLYDDGADPPRAAAIAREADAALVVVGYTHADEGEYIPPDIFADFLPSFPPPEPAICQAFADAIRARASTPACRSAATASGSRSTRATRR